MQPKTELAPRLGEWNETANSTPDIGENVLGYWYGGDCPTARVVFFVDDQWFDSEDPECDVSAPDAWAQIIYPGEGE